MRMPLQICSRSQLTGSWIALALLVVTLVACNRINFSLERHHAALPEGAVEPGLTERANRGDPNAQYRIATLWLTAEPGKRDTGEGERSTTSHSTALPKLNYGAAVR